MVRLPSMNTDGGCGVTRDSQTEKRSERRRNGEDSGTNTNNEGSGPDRRSAPCGRVRTADASTTRTSSVRVCRPDAPTPPRYARREPACLLRFSFVGSVPPFVNLLSFLRPLRPLRSRIPTPVNLSTCCTTRSRREVRRSADPSRRTRSPTCREDDSPRSAR